MARLQRAVAAVDVDVDVVVAFVVAVAVALAEAVAICMQANRVTGNWRATRSPLVAAGVEWW